MVIVDNYNIIIDYYRLLLMIIDYYLLLLIIIDYD